MIDDRFRPVLAEVSGPLIRFYQLIGVTPNVLTVVALLLGLAAAGLVIKGVFLGAAALWWVGRILDGTDGILARATGADSDFGAYLDIVCDMAAYSGMVVAFFLRFPELALTWVSMLFLYVLCITSALTLGSLEQKRALSARDNRGLRLGAGLAEGGETGIAYTLFLLFPQWLGELTLVWLAILGVTVVARTLLVKRVFQAARATEL